MDADLKPYDRMKDSGVEWLGDVPAHWDVSQVKRYYAIQLGKMLQPLPRVPQDVWVRYLKARNVQWFGLDTKDVDSMYASADEICRYGVRSGDLLICEGGEGGRCALATGIQDVEPCIIQNALHRVRPCYRQGGPVGVNGYLRFVLSAVSCSGWFDALNDKATIAHFTAEKFGALLVPVSPLPEQTAIARFLDHATDRIDRCIQTKEKLIALLEEQQQVVVHDAVTGRIDIRTGKPYPEYKPSGIGQLREVPAHWEECRLKQICRLVYGDSLADDSRIAGETPVYGSNGIVGKHDKANTVAPCIVVGRKGSFGKVNYCSEPAFAIDTTFFVDARSSNANIRWLYYLLRSLRLDAITKDSAVPGLHREDAYQAFSPLPVLEEQAAIASYLDEATAKIHKAIDRKNKEIELLREYRARLIADVVTGKLDVQQVAIAG